LRVAGIERRGGPVEMIEVADVRAPGAGEVLIEVRAAGVGNWDEIVRTGDWDVGRDAPMALGVEAAGVIAGVGHGVRDWSVDDLVLTHPLPLADQGTWAPYLIVRAGLLARKPADVSWADAGAFPVPALTAVQMLDDVLRPQSGESVLVNGAGSVTGSLIVSLCVLRGVEVLATAGPSSREHVLRAGATTVVDYHNPDWPAEIRDATGGRGVDTAANVARGGAASALRAVRDGGRLATITSDPPDPEREIRVNSVFVRPDAAQLQMASQHLGAGRLTFRIGAAFPLEQSDQALKRASAGLGGAVVLEL
jgi:NADPH:quinone reductase-like Zn-dependent oxidoreductase